MRQPALAIHGPITTVHIAMTTTSVRKGTCVMVEGNFFFNDYRFGRTLIEVLIVSLPIVNVLVNQR